jgi:hypothetical protein
MVSRKKNLLDAFKASAPEGRAMAERKKNTQTSPGGPFAPGKPSTQASWGGASEPSEEPEEPAFVRKPSPLPATVRRALADRTVRIALGALVLVVLGAFWLGRRSGSALAGDGAEAAAASPGALLRPGAARPAPRAAGADLAKKNETSVKLDTADDQAFRDKRNQFTTRIVQYNSDESGKTAARKTYDYLRGQGVPAIQPILSGTSIVICAGSAAKQSELTQLTAHIRGLPGPEPKPKKPLPFADAYVVNIDPYVQR